MINSETVGLDVAFWFMQDARYEQAILNRWNAGVPVRILVDPRANPTYPGNSDMIAAFQQAGIPIRYRTASGILHWKMMLFAGQNTVEFDGANYSPTAFIYQSQYSDYEDEAIYFADDPDVVNSFKSKYDDLWQDTTNYANYANITGALTRNYPTWPQDPDLNFPQQQDYALRILKNDSKETQKIDVIMYRITDERHTNAMIAAQQRGVPVRVYSDTFEYRNTSRLWHAYNLDKLYAAGIPVRVRAHAGLNHQKLVLFYGQALTVFGSSNWTTPSANQQQEHNYFTSKAWIFQWFQSMFERKWNNLAPNGAIESQPFVPLPPDKPVYQSPLDGTVGALRSQELVWDGGPWGQVYDIYFGTDPNPPLLAANQQLGPNDPSSPSFQSWILPLLQPGTTYYYRIVSKTMAGMTAKGPIASFTTAGNPPPPPQPATNASTIVMWTSTDVAASNVVGNWQWQTDSTAAGGSALWNPDHGQSKISPPLSAPANYFTTTFNAVGGVPYHLWVRLKAQNNSTSNNSVSVQFSNAIDQYGSPLWPIGSTQGAEVALTDPSGTLNGWGWEDNGFNGAPATLVYFPASGTQTIEVQQRSDGAIVDQIILSPDAFISTPPGGTLNDNTIYGSTIDGAAPPPAPPAGPPAPPDVPAPFQHQDIGAVGMPGYATFDNTSTFNIVAAGADVWGNADSFHYVYQPLSGDGTIVARVNSLTNVNSRAKAGVMIRESLAPGAANAFMFISTTKGVQFQTRPSTGAATTAVLGPIKTAPYWVRVDRAGSTFTGYYSKDGITWTQLGTTTMTMAANALIGIGVTSHNTDAVTQAAVDNVSVNGVPVQACNAAITPASQLFNANGDTGTIAVSAANTCSWTATSTASWLTVTSGSSGTGNGTVTLSAAANTGAARSASVYVAGLTFSATQNAANCSFSITPTSQSLTSSGGPMTVNVTTGSWCSWSAVSSDPSWLTITSGASGTGNGTVTLNAAANTGPARSTTATIAGQTFAVSEAAAACTMSLSPASQSLTTAAQSFTVGVTTPSFCSWTATSGDPSWLAITSGASGTGSGTVTFAATANAGPARSVTLTIGGQSFVTSQAGAVLPANWANQDIGAVGKAGSSSYDWPSSTFTVKGAGADVWGTADALQYAYRPLSGDGVMIARVASVSNTNSWVKAGVMIRESVDPGSAQAFMLVSYSKGTAFQRRTVAGGTSASTAGPLVAAPYWVKIERIGNTINGYVSPNGTTWTLVGTDTFSMAANVLVGLGVSSHTTTSTATATFDNVSAPSIPCSFSLSPSSQSYDVTGGNTTLTLTASDPSCTWTASSSDPSWLTVTSSASGAGNALVTVNAAANNAGARNASITVGNATFTASQSAAACSYSISPTSQFLSGTGDTASVTVTTGSWCSWTATSGDPSWLTITSGASGTGSGTVTFSAAANTGAPRSTTSTIAGQSFTANQAGGPCSFSLSPTSQAMANGGDTGSIAVTTSSWCTWTATSSDTSWLTVTGASAGTGSGTVTVAAAANPAGPRTATVTIGDQTFTANQAAAACSFSITPASQSVGASGGSATVNVTTGSWCSWTAASNDPTWLTVTSGASGTGSGTVTLAASANAAGARSTTATIAGQTFTMSQDAAPCSFSLSPASQSMGNSGGTGSIAVTTGSWCTWTATSSAPSWLSVTGGASGTGSGTVTVSATANPAGPRSATVTVGGQTATVSEAAAACSYAISPATQSVATGGGTMSIAVTTPSWCGWNAASNNSDWLTVTSASTGTGNGTVSASATANTGAARSGTITVAGLTFTANQAAAVMPSGWSNQDIGAVGKAGSSSFNWTTNVWTVKGAGADIWGTADAFQYAYKPMTGDGVVIARVASVSSTNAWVKAGVMIRETLDPSSTQALMLVSYSKGLAFQRRTTTGGTSTSTTGALVAAPYWVKLERIGNTFNAYSSADGSTWTLVGTDTIAMGTNVYVGFAVSSHTTTATATATFDNVSTP
ncbi:MAG TPA: BACON domain-containing carbohydrate-binding protein [Vicinamibacterales bacterium]|nr:BACON domain-containing carbohydrate-binding protein [Vicinamibacterales bacterium]